jgi:hypothetical protein
MEANDLARIKLAVRMKEDAWHFQSSCETMKLTRMPLGIF